MYDKLTLTKSEVEAIVDYVFQHVRGNTGGKAHKVWVKMMDFIERSNDDESTLVGDDVPGRQKN